MNAILQELNRALLDADSFDRDLILDSIQELNSRLEQQSYVDLKSFDSMVKYLKSKPIFTGADFRGFMREHPGHLKTLRGMCELFVAEQLHKDVQVRDHHCEEGKMRML